MADFKISYDGTWFHEGVHIERAAIAKLFSDRALKIDENGDYWLQSPHEKYAVEVEDVPFVIVDYIEVKDGIDFVTNMSEVLHLGPENPLVLKADRMTGQMLPYIEVRAGLFARLGRPVYYHLAQRFGAEISSRGMRFALGNL